MQTNWVDMRASAASDSQYLHGEPTPAFSGRDLGTVLLVLFAYVASARFELRLIHSQTSMGVIWLPAGISIAAILLNGRRIVPAIFLASLCVELVSSVPLLGALAIAGGNTAEALVGGYLANRF